MVKDWFKIWKRVYENLDLHWSGRSHHVKFKLQKASSGHPKITVSLQPHFSRFISTAALARNAAATSKQQKVLTILRLAESHLFAIQVLRIRFRNIKRFVLENLEAVGDKPERLARPQKWGVCEHHLLHLVKARLSPILAVELFSRGVTTDRLKEIINQMLAIKDLAVSLDDDSIFNLRSFCRQPRLS